MDFGFSDEQVMLRDTARRFVSDICPPERAKEWDETALKARRLLEVAGASGEARAVAAEAASFKPASLTVNCRQ